MRRTFYGAITALAVILLPAVTQSACPAITGWNKNFLGADGLVDSASAVAVDASGNVVVVGSEETVATGKDWKIIKYDPAGTILYQASYNGPDSLEDVATGVAVDSTGNIWVVGYETRIDPTNGPQHDWRITKYSPDLSTALVSFPYDYEPPPNDPTVDGYKNDEARAVAVDASDNVIIAGFVNAWAGGPDNYDWLIQKYDSSGAFIWEYFYPYPAGGNDIPSSVAVDSTGAVVIAGNVTSGPALTDWFVLKLDSAGGYLYESAIGGGSGLFGANSVSIDKTTDDIVVGGYADDGTTVSTDWFILKYDPTLAGAYWVQGYAGLQALDDRVMGVAVDAQGEVMVSGFINDYPADQDWFVAKLKGVDGNPLWTFPINDAANPVETIGGMAMSSIGQVYISGMQDTGSGDGNWHTLQIVQPSCIETAVTVIPGSVCLGGSVEVILTVSNTGLAPANSVSATMSIDVGQSRVALVTGPAGTVNIPAGGMHNFTWAFNSTGFGALNFTATIFGTDGGSLAGFTTVVSGISAMIFRPAILSSVMTVNPMNVLVGNPFEVVLDVTNGGDSDAVGVEATMWVDSGGSLINFTSGAGPGPYTILAGTSSQFTWTWAAAGNGLAGFTATVTGADSCAGGTVSTGDSGSITIPGALLSATLIGIPSPACFTSQIQVSFTVTNIGSGNATGVSATLSVDEGESLLALFAADSGPVTLLPSGAHTFSWTFSITGTPQIAFTATVMGLDVSTGLTVMAPKTAPPIPILLPASLEGAVSVNTFSSPVMLGDMFEVVLTVTNTGGMTASAVATTMWFDAGGTLATLSGGPGGPVDIPAGGSQYFTWLWVASTDGPIAMTASATGIDSCRGWSMTANGTGSVTVQGPGKLAASLGVEPSVQLAGNTVDVIMTVTNTGLTDVMNISVTMWVAVGPSRVSVVSEPVGLASLLAGTSATFTWTYNALSMGPVRFTVTVTGTELGAGTFVSASAYADLTVLSKGVLSALLTLTPATVVSGGTVKAVVRVWNSAPAGSLGVIDVEHVPPPLLACPAVPRIDAVLSGSATVAEILRPAPGCTSLIAGASAWYTWTFTASGVGTADFSVSFTGVQDKTPVEEVYAYAVRHLSIVAPASLSATLSVSPVCGDPCSVDFGDTIKVRLEVGNTTGSAASNVHPLTMTVTGSALTLVSAPSTNRFIPGFSSFTYEWTYRVSGSGSVTLFCGAAGTEFTLLTPLYSNSASLWIGIPTPSMVNVTVTGPEKAVFGQEITLPVTVSNVSATSIIQTGFQVLWNGSSAGVSVVSMDPTLPKLTAPNTSRSFTLVIRLDSKAETGEGTLQVLVVATEQYSPLDVESVGGRFGLELVAVSDSDPTGTTISANPWKPGQGELEIRYVVTAAAAGGTVSVKVYTLGGELVKTLVSESQPEGSYPVKWDGRNSRGQRVASGIYLLLVETRAGKRLQKLAVIK